MGGTLTVTAPSTPTERTERTGETTSELTVSWTATIAVLAGSVLLTLLGAVVVEVLLAHRDAAEVAASLAPGRLASDALVTITASPLVAVALLVPLPLALLAEHLLPVPSRVGTGIGWRFIGQDALWFALSMLAKVGLAALLYGGAVQVRDHLGIGLSDVRALPPAVAVVAAVLLADLLRYWSHRLRHAVPLLWRFHAVHHAQERLNPLTEHRVHPVDLLVHLAVFGIAFAVLDLSWPVMGVVTAVGMLHTRLYHSSIRTHYGPLRHVLVTPQSHRIHHSLDPAHHDTNFGTMFSVWDRLFGTAHADVTSYPPVGVDDPTFPRGSAVPTRDLPRVVAAQLVHPFLAGSRATTPERTHQGGGASPTSAP